MSDEPASNTPTPTPEPAPAPDSQEDSSPFDAPPMDVVTRNDQSEGLEARDGD
jgi:hypothetical protein